MTTATKKIEAKDADFLCGRKSKCLNHPGTLFVKQRCTALLSRYITAEKEEVMRINKDIVEEVYARGGTFLTQKEMSGDWVVLPVAKAREKVAVMFHNLKSKYGSSPPPQVTSQTQAAEHSIVITAPHSEGGTRGSNISNNSHDETLTFTKIFQVFNIDPDDAGPKKLVAKFRDTLAGVRMLMAKKEESFNKILTSFKLDEVDLIQLQEFRVWFQTRYLKAAARPRPVFGVEVWLAHQEAEVAACETKQVVSDNSEATAAAPLNQMAIVTPRVSVAHPSLGTTTNESRGHGSLNPASASAAAAPLNQMAIVPPGVSVAHQSQGRATNESQVRGSLNPASASAAPAPLDQMASVNPRGSVAHQSLATATNESQVRASLNPASAEAAPLNQMAMVAVANQSLATATNESQVRGSLVTSDASHRDSKLVTATSRLPQAQLPSFATKHNFVCGVAHPAVPPEKDETAGGKRLRPPFPQAQNEPDAKKPRAQDERVHMPQINLSSVQETGSYRDKPRSERETAATTGLSLLGDVAIGNLRRGSVVVVEDEANALTGTISHILETVKNSQAKDIPRLVSLLLEYKSAVQVQQACLRRLAELAKDNVGNCRSIVDADGIPFVLESKQLHKDDQVVQMSSRSLLLDLANASRAW